MNKHSILSLILIMVLMAGLLTGCGAEQKPTPASTEAPQLTSTPAAETKPTPVPDPTMTEEELLAYMTDRALLLKGEDTEGETYGFTGCTLDTEGTVAASFYAPVGMSSLKAVADSGKEYEVTRVVGYDTVTSLAILKLEEETLAESETGEGLTVVKQAAETKTFAEPKHELHEGDTVYFYDVEAKTLSANIVTACEAPFGAVSCFELQLTDAAQNDSEANIVVVNGYGELLGFDPFVASMPDAETGDYIDVLLCPAISAAEKIECDKELTLKDFNDWFNKEIELCWSPVDLDGVCYFSLTRTYQEITGVKCKRSGVMGENGGYSNGYRIGYDFYEYDMSVEEYDVYATYLTEIGYHMEGSDGFLDGTSYYYWNENEGVCIDLFVSNDGKTLSVYPKYGYIA